jgi:hypothetical protein
VRASSASASFASVGKREMIQSDDGDCHQKRMAEVREWRIISLNTSCNSARKGRFGYSGLERMFPSSTSF